LETPLKVGLQPEGAYFRHSETVINLIRPFFLEKGEVLATKIAKFATQ